MTTWEAVPFLALGLAFALTLAGGGEFSGGGDGVGVGGSSGVGAGGSNSFSHISSAWVSPPQLVLLVEPQLGVVL